MIFNVIVCCVIGIASSSDIDYTIESFTTDGTPCMGNCVNSKCITGWSSTKSSCYSGDKPGLQYYTAQYKTKKKLCRSRCGKFDGYANDWCYVSNDEWDYCNSQKASYVKRNVVFGQNVKSGPCKNDCATRGNSYLWCNTLWDNWDYCLPDKYNFDISYTIDGRECVGICGKFGEDYNWCYDYDHKWNYCSPPATDFSFLAKMHDDIPKLINQGKCDVNNRRKRAFKFFDITDFAANGVVSGYADLFERPGNGFDTEDVNEYGNPVTRYTVVPAGLDEDPTLPLVLRATVTPATMRASNSRSGNNIPVRVERNLQRMGMNVDIIGNNQDERGHLVPDIFGGPAAIYNFIPQTHNVNRGEGSLWYGNEIRMRDFVRSTGGSAVMTIVVLYHDLPRTTRPEGIAMNVALYNPDGTLHDECRDQYYTNDT